MRHTVERGTAMADVTLRAYVKEIDNLIERDQLDEAIAHCRHILQIYPKHLGTYRLLGKAYLEAKRFGDAADIFQRVLSAVPEDFVSHIGMAIVREDEGNLDAAIWHMERAFEANPANPAIRQELSRLIGRRDGLEPHKIRLTRGALARQYAQGELFPQAIAELRSALQEDPDRPDLELLLAKMYWRSEQYDSAKTLCKQIIEKLPYSFDANRIMAAVYQATNNPEKAGEYHRRLAALDPYMAFVDSAASDPKQISASAVQIDHSDWLPGQPLPTAESAEPDWVSSLGVDLSEDEELPEVDSVPSWMGELEGEVSSRPAGSSALSPQEPEEALSEEGDIPDWMKEAGWEPSSGEIQESPVSFSNEELEALDSGGPMPIPEEERGDEEEIAPADIPDWLQDIAPSDIPAEPEPEPEMEQQDRQGEKKEFVPDWLADISSEADDVPPEPLEDTQEVMTPDSPKAEPTPAVVELDDEDKPEVPTWVEDQAPGATSTIISWLGDRPGIPPDEEQEAEKLPEEPVQMSQQPAPTPDEGEIPSWLDDLDIEELEEATIPEPSEELEEEDEAPSWLAGVADAASNLDLDMQEPAAAQDEIELEAASDVEGPEDDEGWLRELAEAGLEEEPAATGETPDWVAEDEVESAEPETVPEVPNWLQGIAETDEAASSVSEDEEPDWLRGMDLEEETAEAPSVAPRQEVPDWLQGIAEPSSDDESAVPASEDAPQSWQEEDSDRAPQDQEEVEDEFDLQSLREFEAEISAEPDLEEPAISRAPEEIGVGEDLDDEEVYQWLESLAQDEAEEPGEAPAAAVETRPAEATPIIDESVPPEEPEASLDWLEDLASERGLDVDVTAQADASQLPTAQESVPTSEPSTEQEEEAPDWLREMASSPTDETVVTSRPPEFQGEFEEPEPEEPEVPDWLDEATSIAADVPAEPEETEAQIAIEEPAAPEKVVDAVQSEQVQPVVEPLQEEVEPPAQPPGPPEPEPVQLEKEQVAPEPVDEAPVTPPSVIEPTPPVPEPEVEPTGEAPAEVSAKKEGPPAKPAKPPAKFKEPLTEPTQLLQSARQALSAGDAGRALSDYRKLIDRKQDIDTVIKDLQRAAERYPNLPKVWQALGDAYMKADQLPDAIKAYKRGMEVA
jgi:tetratricopeptide (TPR) repeat protein